MATIKKRGKAIYSEFTQDTIPMANKLKNQNLDASTSLVRKKRAEKEALHQAALFEEQVRTGAVVGGKIKFADFCPTLVHRIC